MSVLYSVREKDGGYGCRKEEQRMLLSRARREWCSPQYRDQEAPSSEGSYERGGEGPHRGGAFKVRCVFLECSIEADDNRRQKESRNCHSTFSDTDFDAEKLCRHKNRANGSKRKMDDSMD